MSAIDKYRESLRILASEALGVLSLIANAEKQIGEIQKKIDDQKKKTTEIYEKIDDILDLDIEVKK